MNMEPNVRIPLVFHYIWFGDSEKRDKLQGNIDKLKIIYPEFEIKIWTENELDVNETNFSKTAYEKKKFAFVADYFRSKILYEEGGIYLDFDVIPLKSFIDEIIKNKFIIGFEYSKLIGTGIIGATPKHDLVKIIYDYYKSFENIPQKKIEFKINNIIWTYMLIKQYGLLLNNKTQKLRQGIKVFDYHLLNSYSQTPHSFFIHQHEISWTNNKFLKITMIRLLKFTQKNQYFISWILISVNRSFFHDLKRELKYLNKIN